MKLSELITAVWALQRKWHKENCSTENLPDTYVCDEVSEFARRLETLNDERRLIANETQAEEESQPEGQGPA